MLEEQRLTICKKCDNVKIKENNGIWYNYFCKAVELEKKMNYVTGKMGHVNKNSFEEGYFSDDKYEFCNKVNKGDCKHFEVKKLLIIKFIDVLKYLVK